MTKELLTLLVRIQLEVDAPATTRRARRRAGLGDGDRDDGRPGDGDLGAGQGPAPDDAQQRPRLGQGLTVRARGSRGAAIVDFVLVLAVLVPVFLGILQLALVLLVRNTLAAAASEGARYAATFDRDWDDGEARTRAQIRGALADRYADDVDARRGADRRRAGHRGHRARGRAGARARRPGDLAHRDRARGRGGAMKAAYRAGERRRRADLAGHPAARPDDLDRALGLRGAARRVRRQRRGPVRRAGLRPRARRRDGGAAGAGGGGRGAGRPGHRRTAGASTSAACRSTTGATSAAR